MKKTLYTLAATIMLLMGSYKLQAQCSMGNSGQQTSLNTNLDGGLEFGQSFKPNCSGALTSISLNLVSLTTNAFTGNITIYAGSGNSGAVVYSQVVSASPFSGNSVFNLTTPPTVVAGNTYTLIISNNDISGSEVEIRGTDGVTFGSDSYTDGTMYLVFPNGNAIILNPTFDLLFQVDITAPACTPTTSTTNATICVGGSYNFGDTARTTAGTYIVHKTNAGGCDSTATLNLSILPGSGYNGKALSFDGNDDYVALPTGIVNSLTSITIESWFLINDNNYWQRVFDFGSGTGINMFFTTRSGDDVPRFAITTAGGNFEERITAYGLGGLLQTGVWHHVAITLNAATNTGTLYIDGVQVGQNTSMTLTPSSLGTITQNYLGKSQYNDPYFNGSIDEFRIWNTAKTLAQIKASMQELTGNETGLVAYYNFNATSGTVLANKKTSSLNGTLNNFSLTGTTSNWSAYNEINITGASAVCVGAQITLGNDAGLAGGVWSSNNNRATVNASGVATGANQGTASIKYVYTTGGCNATATKTVAVTALPAIPNIVYAPGNTVNPRTGAGGAGNYCSNRTFNMAGYPAGGVWSTTGAASVVDGINTATYRVGTVTTGPGTGAASVIYTITNANGCQKAGAISGNVITCASKHSVTNNQQAANTKELSVYPNPAHSIITIKVDKLRGNDKVLITDIYGKIVLQQIINNQSSMLNIQGIAKGMYFVTVVTNEGRKMEKLIVE
jgi:Concanavalin A-like lectin/glucanases superfamily/Secretion system C-terminal sorting domain